MKCPIDESEMVLGFIDGGCWLSGDKPALAGLLGLGRKVVWVSAWKCPKCGKVELYANPN